MVATGPSARRPGRRLRAAGAGARIAGARIAGARIAGARVAGALIAGALALAGCSGGQGGTGSGSAAPPSSAAAANPNLDLGTSLGGKPLPNVKLVNQFGQPMSLSQFRGQVLLIGFVDSECATVCPLTTLAMLEAKQMLGAAGDHVQLLGINANPDAITISDVMGYSRAHNMVNRWDFLTGSLAQLKASWKAFNVYAKIDSGQVDHTPALYVIDAQGREQKVYLTTMAYSSITQSAQVVAQEVAGLLPGHPVLAHSQSLAYISGQTPAQTVRLPAALPASPAAGGPVTLGPGKPHLVVFFATWLSEIGDLRGQLTSLNSYVQAAKSKRLPSLTAVDEAVTEPTADAARTYIQGLKQPLSYQVGLDTTGRLADGYGVQDQPWFVLTSSSGKIVWSHDGWLSPSDLEAAVAEHS